MDLYRKRVVRMGFPPVLDIGPLVGAAAGGAACARGLVELAERWGCLYLRNHGIPQACIDRVQAEGKAYFARPLAEKMDCYIGRSPNHRGYVPTTEMGAYADEAGRRHYEAFDTALDLPPEDPDHRAHHRLLGPNLWPADRPAFREAVTDYYRRISALGAILGRALEGGLGMPEGTLAALQLKPMAQLRLIHYLENPFAEGPAVGPSAMGAHTDYECFTLLHQDGEGLQVFHEGEGWRTVPLLPGGLLFLVGDMVEVLSNGRLRSSLHRVLNTGRERFSIPFFAATDFDAVLAPHPACVGPDRPPAYAPVVAGHHLLGQLLRDFPYLRERQQRGELPLDLEIPQGNPFEGRRGD